MIVFEIVNKLNLLSLIKKKKQNNFFYTNVMYRKVSLVKKKLSILSLNKNRKLNFQKQISLIYILF